MISAMLHLLLSTLGGIAMGARLAVIVPMTISSVVHACAPQVAPRTALAIIKVESGGHPWAIGDNTSSKAYFPNTRDDAVALAADLLAKGHSLDVGLMQVDSIHFESDEGSLYRVFDPCVNVAMGSRILEGSYQAAVRVYGPGQVALFHAFERYNSGRLLGSPRYAKTVWEAGLTL
ncbi:MAG TPA: transglycosylase SLT domain-containing protein [Candidatus Baltobacteraceae bacterium]|nr:transglycosylase SLT domain-containing protein [Candidatus Baltobacteraceae bacterium]